MVRYDNAYDPDSSYGSAVRLVEAAEIPSGVVLDLGCGYAAVATPLEELGLTYVGVDLDPIAVEAVRARGMTASTLDLGSPPDELRAALTELLDGRPPAVVLALDSLEHLPRPEVVLDVLRDLAGETTEVSLVVSYPNVTHYDIGANLLSGRWHQTDEGLLDRTHLQLRDEHGLVAMLAGCGWREVASDDVIREHSEQLVPSDSPFLRPGAPLRELLWDLRGHAGPAATTFQFVRRYVTDEPVEVPIRMVPDEERELVGVIVVADDGSPSKEADATLADLAAQRLPVLEADVVGPAEVAAAVARQTARWIVVLEAGTRLAADWSILVKSLATRYPGKVLRVGALAFDAAGMSSLPPAPLDLSVLVTANRVADLDDFDPVAGGPRTTIVVDAYAVPLEALASSGVEVGPPRRLGADRIAWIARVVQLCGLVGTDIAAVAVPDWRVVRPDPVMALVTEVLDEHPMVLPRGSARRLADMRRRADDADAALATARVAAAHAEARALRLSDQLRRLDHDLAAEREELARLREEHSHRLARRLIRRLRNSG